LVAKNNVLIIGGGIAGIQAALDLADMGNYVYLVEKSPSIGGHMAQLDKTFPTNDCSICILSPKMVECARHPNIQIYTYSELEDVKQTKTGYKVIIRKKQRYVNEEKCTGCRLCSEICPVKVPNEFDCGLRLRSAIYIPFAQAIPNVAVLDKNSCIECRSCIKTCPANAIEFDNPPEGELIELEVSAIIIAVGFELFDPSVIKRYNYKKLKDVITSLEYERLMSASGPTNGRIIRLSNGKPVKSLVLIHCVGSRNVKYNEYCSQVCCMYATKQAIITKEHDKEIDIKILYNDMRAYGKGFQEFVNRAKDEYNIEYIRASPSRIERDPILNKIIIYYEDITTGSIKKIETDLVVLCATMTPNRSIKKLSSILGLKTNKYGFLASISKSEPINSTTKGIYIIGACKSPKDIPESVVDASASAALACRPIPKDTVNDSISKSNSIDIEIEKPNKKTDSDELRIGVFICHCGTNIGGILNIDELLDYTKNLEGVVYTTSNLYTCSSDTQEIIKKAIVEHRLNRVVVASCTPTTHEPLFRKTCQQAGLNPYLFELANIREQCSWVHFNFPEAATDKAKDLINMAVARVRYLEPQSELKVSVNPSALIIGGGPSGIAAAKLLLEKGFKVDIVEKSNKLGGYLNNLFIVNNDLEDPNHIINDYISQIMSNNNCSVHLNSEVMEISGSIGDFLIKICKENKCINNKNKVDLSDGEYNKDILQLRPGVIIVSIGAQEFKPYGYFEYGKNEKVLTLTEFHKLLKSDDLNTRIQKGEIQTIAFIQCVGSRLDENQGVSYCSKICCGNTFRIIKYLNKKYPNIKHIVFYRDITVYGLDENLYREVRYSGTLFIRYDKANPPQIIKNKDKLLIKSYNVFDNKEMEINADLLILATPLIPAPDTEKLSKILKVPLAYNGFYLEAHVISQLMGFIYVELVIVPNLLKRVFHKVWVLPPEP